MTRYQLRSMTITWRSYFPDLSIFHLGRHVISVTLVDLTVGYYGITLWDLNYWLNPQRQTACMPYWWKYCAFKWDIRKIVPFHRIQRVLVRWQPIELSGCFVLQKHPSGILQIAWPSNLQFARLWLVFSTGSLTSKLVKMFVHIGSPRAILLGLRMLRKMRVPSTDPAKKRGDFSFRPRYAGVINR